MSTLDKLIASLSANLKSFHGKPLLHYNKAHGIGQATVAQNLLTNRTRIGDQSCLDFLAIKISTTTLRCHYAEHGCSPIVLPKNMISNGDNYLYTIHHVTDKE